MGSLRASSPTLSGSCFSLLLWMILLLLLSQEAIGQGPQQCCVGTTCGVCIDGRDAQALLLLEQTWAITMSSWSVDSPCVTWSNVECNNNGRITSLNLSHSSLQGSVPDALSTLTNLQILALDGNQLYGSIPASIYQGQPSLTTFHIDNNYFTEGCPGGTLPVDTTFFNNCLQDCSEASLNQTQRSPQDCAAHCHVRPSSAAVLFSVASSSRLDPASFSWNFDAACVTWERVVVEQSTGRVTGLDLSNLGISGFISSSIGGLTDLTSLNLGYNFFASPVPESICPMTNLEHLSLGHNQFYHIPDCIGGLKLLQSLDLSYNWIAGPIPGIFSNFINLTSLNLRSNFLDSSMPEFICTMIHLEFLFLDVNGLSGSLLECFGNLTSMKALDLSSNSFHSSVPSSICMMNNLEILNMDQTGIKGRLPKCLQNLMKLQQVSFKKNFLYGDIADFSQDLASNVSVGILENFFNLGCSFSKRRGYDPSYNCLQDCPSGIRLTIQRFPLECASYCHILPTAGQALLDLARAFNLDKVRLSWDLDALCGQWKNVTIELSTGRVKSLNLSFLEITGPIPTSMSELLDLTSLDLQRNKLSGNFPEFLGLLTNLMILTLQGNKISGSIPKSLGNLTNLIHLDLSYLELTGNIPSDIGGLLDLTFLALQRNKISGSIPESLGNLTNLVHLDLSYLELSGNIPSDIGGLLGLTSLALQRNKISGSIPESLGNLTNLIHLDLSNLELTGFIPSNMSAIFGLTSLDLSNNQLTGRVPETFSKLRSLAAMKLQSNALYGTVPTWINKLRRLSTMDVSENNFHGVIVNPVDHRCIRVNLDHNCLASVACPGTGPLLGEQKDLSSDECLRSCTLSGQQQCVNPSAELVQSFLDFCTSNPNSVIPGFHCSNKDPFIMDLSQLWFDNAGFPLDRSVTKLSNLVVLILDKTNIGSTLPSVISSLRGLAVLSLAGNQILGSLLDSLSALASLRTLDLRENRLRSTLPQSFTSLTNLQTLKLAQNQIYGPLLDVIFTLPALHDLSLDHNQLSGSIPLSAQGGKAAAMLLHGNLSLSHNFFTAFDSASPLSSPAANWTALSLLLQGNCLPNASLTQSSPLTLLVGPQRDSTYACSAFCGATSPSGACKGRGFCYLSDFLSPTCDCQEGYSPDPKNPGTCIPGDSTLPFDYTIPEDLTLGFNQSGTTVLLSNKLNRYFRHLSQGYSSLNGAAAWNLLSLSNWISENHQFFPSVPLSYLPFPWESLVDQDTCAASFAVAAADAVAAACTLASASSLQGPASTRVPRLAFKVIKGCSADSGGRCPQTQQGVGTCAPDYTEEGCAGGLPGNALNMVVETGLPLANTFSEHLACSSTQAEFSPFKVVMYEKVQLRGWFGLLLAVSSQPAVVSLQGSYWGFQSWTTSPDHSSVFRDPDCYSGSLDHTVLVVGYQLLSFNPYWVLRNSWGSSWGDRGYMRMAMQAPAYSSDPILTIFGTCGIYAYPAFYPVPAPLDRDPCYSRSFQGPGMDTPTLSPCGGGVCKPKPEWGSFSYTCDCSSLHGFVPVNNTVPVSLPGSDTGITQTCAPADVCNLSIFNPCGVGTCLNDGAGGYACLCPLGFKEDLLESGLPICSVLGQNDTQPSSIFLPLPVSCYRVYVSLGLTQDQFLASNQALVPSQCGPGDDAEPLAAGIRVNVSKTSLDLSTSSPGLGLNLTLPQVGCNVSYFISPSDTTCTDIANTLGLLPADIARANPGLNCTSLVPHMLICVQRSTPQKVYPCLTPYPLTSTDTCDNIIASRFSTAPRSPKDFFFLNPGINCNALASSSSAFGQQWVCLAYATRPCTSGKTYQTSVGETCLSLLKKGVFKDMGDITPSAVCSFDPIPTSTCLCLPE